MTYRQKKLVSLAASIGLALTIALPTAVFAQANLGATNSGADITGLNAVGNSVVLGGGDVRTTAARIINVALGFLGIIAVVIVLIGGFKYMTSGGNDEKTGEAKKLIASGIIGLAIILSAWAITSFVISNLLTATSTG